ncbi:MAG: hypothetical protein R3F35_01440 [Myxococcota bacterium]
MSRPLRASSSIGAALALGLLVLPTTGCVPSRGGWAGDAFVRDRPELAAIAGQRLADMVPVPALVLEALDERGGEPIDGARAGGADGGRTVSPPRVRLVACRFEPGASIRVRAGGAGWDEAIGAVVLDAFGREVERFGLVAARVDAAPAEIEIEAFVGQGGGAPVGLGDTLIECDVESDRLGAGPRAVRGRIRRAEIRMRRSAIDPAGRLQTASDAAWAGALLHELAHALGFAGHAASGASVLVRDEFVLTQIGRRVLSGEALTDPTLAALHRLAPGELLATRPLDESAGVFLEAIRSLDRARRAAGHARVAVVASVGDREARWSIRYADGRRLGLRFPGWGERLRTGRPLFVWPDRETLAAIEEAGLLERGSKTSASSP